METENPVRVERYIWIGRSSTCIAAQPGYTVYFRIPPDVLDTVRDRYNLDLKKEAKKLAVDTFVGEEKESNGNREMIIYHKVRLLPGAK